MIGIRQLIVFGAVSLTGLLFVVGCASERTWTAYKKPELNIIDYGGVRIDLGTQTPEVAASRSAGCIGCHQNTHDPHAGSIPLSISCVDCHGGDGEATTIDAAHPKPAHPELWPTSANPPETYTLLNHENWDWIRFVNPGDLRVANVTCGCCHEQEVLHVSKHIMTTGAHLWGVAGYANGILQSKRGILGESYSPEGINQMINTVPPPTEEEMARGVVPTLVPLPNFEISQTGNIFRVFEQGSRLGTAALGFNGLPQPLVGLPDKFEDPGKPNNRTSDRGLGTLLRVDLAVLNLHKTRLNDPHLSFLGTNDNPGDWRSSGCTACHIVYANDRETAHSGPYAQFGNMGKSQNPDPMIPKDEPGHPIKHEFTSGIPSSQCMVCHMHQPNSFVNSYYGYTMWSYDTDGEFFWPEQQKYPSHTELVKSLNKNPEEAAARGLWIDNEFLKDVAKNINPQAKHTQFADYHGHGWIFRAAYKMDRKGNLLDRDGNRVDYNDPDKFKGTIPMEGMGDDHFGNEVGAAGRAVHLKDIHAELGMHCVDCHFEQDAHGDGKLYTAYQDAVEIRCQDCHGTVTNYAEFRTSGPASASKKSASNPKGGWRFGEKFVSWTDPNTKRRKKRIEEVTGADGKKQFVQNSMVTPGLSWVIKQVKDTASNPDSNTLANYAHTIRKDGETWGAVSDPSQLAHQCMNDGSDRVECYTCHTSWITACFGCHLPQRSNWRSESHHFTSEHHKNLRQYSSYNPQAVRDAEFLLGVAGNSKNNTIAPVRSSSALLLSSEDGARQRTYMQIPPIGTNGMSSQIFNTHFPHTVRTRETRQCDDCHVSRDDDNNAWLAQTYLLGTNYVNFVGFRAWVGAGEGGVEAVRVTEYEEPQAVLGSHLHRLAFPDWYKAHVDRGHMLADAEEHHSSDARSLQMRGEYLYVADGPGGFRVFDIANVNNKGFSEAIVTSPVSPLGQDTHVSTRFATCVALATNNNTTMSKLWRPENEEQGYMYRGQVQNLHEIYRYAYVTDRYEGLVVVDVDSLTDYNPRNNFIERRATFNPGGALNGAEYIQIAGTTAYICCDRGLVAVDISDPVEPKILSEVGAPHVVKPRSVAVQFRYAFVADESGVQTIDITQPSAMTAVAGARVAIADARDIHVARWYGYVSAGAQGLVILDLERPREPRIDQVWNAEGAIDDLCMTRIGMTNDSVFAYMADGKNGMRVAEIVSPGDGEPRSAYGFSPRPKPVLIATYATSDRAVALSKGLDRDRAVDESGNQMAVFGRIGGRPLNLAEMQRLYLRNGQLYTVTNKPTREPVR